MIQLSHSKCVLALAVSLQDMLCTNLETVYWSNTSPRKNLNFKWDKPERLFETKVK